MNNKGQTLVTFILFIPIIILLFIIVFDLGMYSIEKRKITSSIKESIEYGLNNINSINEDGIKDIVYKNIDENNIKKLDITINNDSISIDITVKYNAIINFITNDIKLSYIGYKIDNNIKIIKR